jgi:cytochrome P450
MLFETIRWLFRRRRRRQSPLFNAETLANPYATYQRYRSSDPVFWDEADERWVLTRYDDIVSVLRSPAASSERAQVLQRFVPPAFRQLLAFRNNSMLSTDAPQHNRLRLLVNKAFTTRAVEAMTDKIQKLVDSLLDPVQPRGRMDIIADLAAPLPVRVIAEMLGVPPEDHAQFKHWSDGLAVVAGGGGSPGALGYGDYRLVARSYEELVGYFKKVAEKRRTDPRNDLLTALVQAEEAGDRLNEDELYANATLILVAGHETTTNLIGNGMFALLRNVEQMQRLKANPSTIDTAVEELLRYDSPVQFTTRVLKDDLEVGGRQLRKGQIVLLVLGAANRDPSHFADPDRLEIGRLDNKHLAFGLGTHFCLGAQLARLEGRIAFQTLLRRLPALHLDGPQPQYREHFNLRGLKSLHVAF